MKWNLRIKAPKHWIGISFRIVFKKREGTPVIGVYNKIGNQYIPFLDYDDITDENFLYPELLSLQEKYDLGNAYLFKTRNGYHVIFADLLDYDEWLTILHSTSCDKDYKTVPQHNGQKAWILRLTKKKNNQINFHNILWNNGTRATNQTVIDLLLRLQVPIQALKNYEVVREEKPQLLFARYNA